MGDASQISLARGSDGNVYSAYRFVMMCRDKSVSFFIIFNLKSTFIPVIFYILPLAKIFFPLS